MNRLDRVNRVVNQYAYLSYAFILRREIYAYYSVSHALNPIEREYQPKKQRWNDR
jgi:hypothetical protein